MSEKVSEEKKTEEAPGQEAAAQAKPEGTAEKAKKKKKIRSLTLEEVNKLLITTAEKMGGTRSVYYRLLLQHKSHLETAPTGSKK